MIFNTSGVDSLNFKVVGDTTQPSNPKENTIWVNTDVEITEWHMGNYPNPNWNEVDGKVFINTEATSDIGNPSFNALKKNGLWVRPLAAIQRDNGAWVRRKAKIYRSGAWTKFPADIVLVENSRLETDYSGKSSTVTTNGNEVTVPAGVQKDIGAWWTVDVTNYKTLEYDLVANASGTPTYTYPVFGIGTNYADGSDNPNISSISLTLGQRATGSIDLSAVTGEVHVRACTYGGTGAKTCTFTFYKVRLS